MGHIYKTRRQQATFLQGGEGAIYSTKSPFARIKSLFACAVNNIARSMANNISPSTASMALTLVAKSAQIKLVGRRVCPSTGASSLDASSPTPPARRCQHTSCRTPPLAWCTTFFSTSICSMLLPCCQGQFQAI